MPREKTISVVPWYSPEQFRQVHKAIFSNDVTEKRWAVDQISVWETRCHPALPTAIEATVVLCRAIIQDILHDSITSLCHDNDIQYIYCLAFIRFVNLTLELKQNAKHKLPLTLMAEKEGLPFWMIQLRNEASHSHCPSLPVLRAGADHAMRYLKRTFWEVEESHIQSYVKNDTDEKREVFDLIDSYKQYKYKEIKEEVECTAEIKKVVDGMRRYLKFNRMKFVELLNYDGVFLFKEEELHCILKGIDNGYLNNSEKIELPDVLEYFWDPVLHLIVKYDLIDYFAELLLLGLESTRAPLLKKLAISWVLNIIRAASDEHRKKFSEEKSSIFITLFETYGAFLDWNKLLFASCKSPCLQTPALFPIMITQINMKEEQVCALMYLVAIYQGKAAEKTEESKHSNYKMFTVEDTKQKQKKRDGKRKRKAIEKNLWSYSSADDDFATVPIGAVLNPVEDSIEVTYDNIEVNYESFFVKSSEENATDYFMQDFDGRKGDNVEEKSSDAHDDVNINFELDMVYRRESNK